MKTTVTLRSDVPTSADLFPITVVGALLDVAGVRVLCRRLEVPSVDSGAELFVLRPTESFTNGTTLGTRVYAEVVDDEFHVAHMFSPLLIKGY
jgi:hypothetical protein